VTARRIAAGVLVGLTAILLIATTLSAYAARVAFDADRFSDRATTTLRDPSVRALIADRVTDELILRNQPDLLAARPLIASAVSGIVGGDAFASLFRRAARDVHRAVLDRDQDTVVLTLVDIGTVASAALEQLRPKLAAELDSDDRLVVLERRVGDVAGDIARTADRVQQLTWLLVALTLAAAIGALALAPDRRRAVVQLGLAAIGAGVFVVIADSVAQAVVLNRVDGADQRVAAEAVWDAYLGDLDKVALLLAGTGAVVAAAAASLLQPVAIDGPMRAAWRALATEPARPGWRAVRGIALVLVGVLVIANPAGALKVAATLVGVLLVFRGVEALLRLVTRPRADAPAGRRRGLVAGVAVAGSSLLLVAGASAALVAGGGVDEPVTDVDTCNGHAELCDRPFDQVVFPATHNAMSVPLPGWFSALQERPIAGQLEDGIRGLLLDTHYADRLPNGRIRTAFDSPAEITEALQQDGVNEAGAEAALRLRGRLGFRGDGERGMYLCHTFCEIGSTVLAPVLDDIRSFLVTHPGDVLVIVNQDGVTPDDFVAAMEEAGLARLAITPPPAGAPWPTLRELIDADRRVLVLAENEAGGAPWYQLAYERLLQETPFEFATPAQLIAPDNLPASCAENRGPADAPLFLLNHWVNTDPVPRPSHAAEVNAYEPLLRRARECQRLRGRLPNLLAVDFYGRGDVFGVADTLNGL